MLSLKSEKQAELPELWVCELLPLMALSKLWELLPLRDSKAPPPTPTVLGVPPLQFPLALTLALPAAFVASRASCSFLAFQMETSRRYRVMSSEA